MTRWFHKHLAFRCIIAGVIFIGLGLVALLLPGQFSSWREKQLLSAARASFERGDLSNAVITCRKLLEGNAFSPEACRMMVAINEQANSPKAISWALKLANFSHNDPEILTKLATLGLKFGETGVAEDALNRLPAPAKGTAATISIQAILAITAGQFEKAESLFERATRLEPSSLKWRLDLLKFQLQFRDLAHADSARQELEALSKNPAVKTDALRALLQEQVNLGLLLAIELPRENAAMRYFGHAKDDPDFEGYLEEIRKFREEVDHRADQDSDVGECPNTSLTPTT